MAVNHHLPSAASGLELDLLSSSMTPQEDLYRYVNEPWLVDHPIPDDKSMYGAFSVLAEEAEANVHAILKESATAEPGSEQRKVGDLYKSFMDEEAVEKRGLTPLLERLAPLRALADDKAALLRHMAALERRGVSGLFDVFIDNDPGNPARYVVFIEQGGISLPDEAYYREDQFEQVREAFVSHLVRVGRMIGHDHAERFASDVLALETKIAAAHWDNVRCRDAQATYNPHTLEQWKSLSTGFDLDGWLEALGLEPAVFAEVVVRQPSFVAAWGTIWSAHTADQIRSWLEWQTVRALSPYLSEEAAQAHFDFYGRTLSGTPTIRARWKRAVSFVESAMGEAVGKLYVDRHFPPRAKSEMDSLVSTLLDAYRESISELEWMSEATKKRALEKLGQFTPKIGYPEKWRDYRDLAVDPEDLIANVEASAEFELRREARKIGRPVDKNEWFMTPQTVNAYYNPGFNEIVFPAAILQYPFFDPERDAAANYGAIGAVIGHEIGHGFDDQGSRFDGEGRLTDWWTPEDRQRFEQRTKELIDQFSALEPRALPGHKVNGELTIGENIGDLGGLAIAWKAYLLSLDGVEPPVVDGLSAAERFFIGWAHSWRTAVRDEEAKRLLQIDPHSPPEFRCNQIARNLDVFYEAFGVDDEDPMFLAPERRVSIW